MQETRAYLRRLQRGERPPAPLTCNNGTVNSQLETVQVEGTLGLPVLIRYSDAWTSSWTALGQFKLSYICTAAATPLHAGLDIES